jgi:nucleoside-diphosphate-sugar epimerase
MPDTAPMPETTPSLGPTPPILAVTGGAGWFGQALLHALVDPSNQWHRDGTIRALCKSDDDVAVVAAISNRIEVIRGDITDAAAIAKLVAGGAEVDVIHAAGVIHPGSVAEFFDVNAKGTQVVVDAGVSSGVRRLVHVSSNSPFGVNPDPQEMFRQDEPFHPYLGYGESKMQGEQSVRRAVSDHGLAAVVVRPPWFYGPYQPLRQTTFFKMVGGGRFPLFGGGHNRRSMVYVDNLVQGVLRAELVEGVSGRSYWIADERPYPVTEIVSTVQEALAAEGVSTKHGGLKIPNLVGNVAEKADRLIQKTGRYQQAVHVLGEMNKTIACDISASRTELGYEPEIALLEGMRRSIRWVKAQGVQL